MTVNSRITVFGIPFDNFSMKEAVIRVDEFLQSGIVNVSTVVNAAKLVSIQKNREQRLALLDSEMILADGLPIVWASHLLGKPLKQRVAGCDLFEELVKHGQDKEHRFFLLGTKPQVITKVKELIQQRYPGAQVAGIRDGYFKLNNEPEIIDMINKSHANVLFLGFSSPKKEEFVLRNREKFTTIRYIQGVGGTFDVFAGVTRRAPKWMQKCGLEWFYRFLQEPGRMWKRYLTTNIAFLLIVLREFLHKRGK
jgi:N-acetylglucosaminyldiphosphoundecaprenol N-acetyl-beta-D-mannosaminyltransferase